MTGQIAQLVLVLPPTPQAALKREGWHQRVPASLSSGVHASWAVRCRTTNSPPELGLLFLNVSAEYSPGGLNYNFQPET